MNTIFVITGQTATGKTNLAVEYCHSYNGELINCDSRQIYKDLDIITGKDCSTIEQYNHIAIHLYDIVTPDQFFSSYEYVYHATPVIQNILKHGKTPVIVGGTYLYIKHLLYGLNVHVKPNQELRKTLDKKSVEDLQKILSDFPTFQRSQLNNSDWNNPRRLIRRIEILKNHNTDEVKELSGKTSINEFGKINIIGLRHKTRESLVSAITKRVEKRIEEGAIDEVKKLLKMGYKKSDPGLQTIGFKQLIEFLEGKITREELIKQWIIKEVQYAKRQYSFMKQDENIIWRFI